MGDKPIETDITQAVRDGKAESTASLAQQKDQEAEQAAENGKTEVSGSDAVNGRATPEEQAGRYI